MKNPVSAQDQRKLSFFMSDNDIDLKTQAYYCTTKGKVKGEL